MPLPKDIQDRRKRAGVKYEDFWSIVTPHMIQYKGGGTYVYSTPNNTSSDTKRLARIKTIEPMNTINDPFAINKFEVRIQKHQHENTLIVGICDSLNDENSVREYVVAYNVTDGLISTNCVGSGNIQYVPGNEGDTIKCVILLSSEADKVVIEVYCNDLRIAEFPCPIPDNGLYGVIALSNNNEEIIISQPEREEMQHVEDEFEVLTDFVCREENGIYKYAESQIPPDYSQTLAIGTIRSCNKINPGTPSGSICVQLLDKGRDSAIAIGLCSFEYPTDCMPGWKEDSAAYHVDISCVLYSSDKKEMVDCLSVGDVLYCRVEPVDGNTKEVMIFFERDGVIVSKSKMWCPSSGLYWCVGMMSIGEKVRIILPRKTVPVVLPTATFEDVWSTPLSNVRHINNDGTCIHDGSLGTSNIGTIRSRNPVDPLCAYPFFEVKLLNSVMANISLGVCDKEYPYSEVPGLSGRSIGFNSHEGSINQSSILPDMTNSRSKPGDVIRCVVEAVDGSSKRVKVSFFVNNVLAQSVIDWTPHGGFYAQICFFPRQEIQIACPLMRPSVLRRGITNPDYNWYECSLTLETIPVDSSIQFVPSFPHHSVSVNTPVILANQSQRVPINEEIIINEENIDRPIEAVPIVIDANVLPCDHPLYRLMYNVTATDGGIHIVSNNEFGYVVCRKQVSEKLPYFEVEVLSTGVHGVAVGLSDGKVYANECFGGNSVALVSSSGNIVGGNDSSLVKVVSVKQGDVIGCLTEEILKSKSSEAKNQHRTFYRKVCFYKNAVFIGEASLSSSMIYSYPTVGLMDQDSLLKIRFMYGLSLQSYFESHIITDDYYNFPMPDNDDCLRWRSIQNCTVIEEGKDTVLSTSNDGSLPPKQNPPTIVQNNTSFSLNDSYFEVELLNPSSMYKTLSIGACPCILNGDNVHIPGEAENSVGFIPLSGLIMRSDEVTSYASEYIVHQAVSSNLGLLIGVGIHYLPSHSCNSVLFFFTINCQEVGQMVYSFPPGGLYPTLAFSYQNNLCQSVTENLCPKLCKLYFPKPWPFCDTQISPWGIARISQNLRKFGSTYIADSIRDSSNGAQGCIPISPSHSYFEAVVLDGGVNFSISVGLAAPQYSFDQHIGCHYPSIGYHIGGGYLLHNGVSAVVSPQYRHCGLRIGCGAIFPEDGSRANAEVFFTIDGVVIACRMVSFSSSGLYPSFYMHTNGGVLELDLSPRNLFRHLKFSTSWYLLHNVLFSDSKLQLISPTDIGLAQLNSVVSVDKTLYVTFRFASSSKTGKVLIGFSNCSDSPMNPSISGLNQSVYFDTVSGTVILIQNGFRKSDDCFMCVSKTEQDSIYGCGLKPFTNSHLALLFFTLNNQIIYSHMMNIRGLQLRPSICLIGTSTKLFVDACAAWPPMSSIGVGYGRYQNVKMIDGRYITFNTDGSNKSKLGFAQSCSAFHSGWHYFEMEIVSRDPRKAIAIGVSSRRYDMKDWVGWKKESLGYHADDGRLFIASGIGLNFGPKLYGGDIVGCGVKLANSDTAITDNSKVEIYFTVNQTIIGDPKSMTVPAGGLFPTVCVESSSEVVDVFFDVPSSVNKMSRLWASAVNVLQAGNIIEHECSSKMYHQKHVKVPIGYCQAARPVTNRKRYFEIEIVECDIKANLSIGLAPLQPENATTIVTSSIMFSIHGHVLVKLSSSVYPEHISTSQKCQVRDRMGCKVEFDSSGLHPISMAFTRNGVQLTSLRIPDEIKLLVPLHPTILLPNKKDSVKVMLNAPLPKFSTKNHIGWLRTERIEIKGAVVRYNEVTSHGKVGIGQTSIPLCRQNHFYEIEVLDLGDDSALSIGAASIEHSFVKQPGWCAYSIGFHGDDGCLFNASGTGYSFGPPWNVGDIIGLGIRPYEEDVYPGTEVQVFFTRNGIEIGHATVLVPEGGFFPTIGFHSKNETVKVDIDSGKGYVVDLARKNWRTLCGVQLLQNPFQTCSVLKFLDSKRRIVYALQSVTADNAKLGLAIAYQPFSIDLQYFEVDILNYGKGHKIALGVVHKNYSPDDIIGWSQSSLAYYTDTGYLHKSSMDGKPFGPVAQVGDKIGCGFIIDSANSKACSLFFTFNGSTIGHQVKCAVPVHGFYPAVGLFYPNDKVSVNFCTTYKPSVLSDCLVGLMRIHNCSYSDSVLLYTGGSIASPANAHFAVSLSSARNYFCACLIDINDNILIGLVTNDYPLTHVPGKQSFSVAYDVFSGKIESAFGREKKQTFVQRCSRGDVVGCGVIPSESKPTYFTFFFVVNDCIVHQLKLSQVTAINDWFPVVGFLPVNKRSLVYLDWNRPLYEAQNVL